MINFCTLFDTYYLPKGLALYQSLVNVEASFHLYVMAFDEKCFRFLKNLSLEHLTVEFVTDFETPELLAVKQDRTRAEYCWTCGPSVIYHFITKYNLPECTYIDADLMFFSPPRLIFDEIKDASIAITEHFTDEISGRFCVQFVYFKNDKDGIDALIWWRDKCIDWCYYRFEDNKFGDQKYLESFPELFNNVHIVKNRGVGIGSWNMNFYSYNILQNTLTYETDSYPIIFFHFHKVSLRVNDFELCFQIEFNLSKKQTELENLFNQYISLLIYVYKKYLNIEIKRFYIKRPRFYKKYISILKNRLYTNRIIRYIYYDLLKVKFSGREKQQII